MSRNGGASHVDVAASVQIGGLYGAYLAKHVVVVAVGRYFLADFVVGQCGTDLRGAADGAGVVGRAYLRCHVVAVGDGAFAALQAHGVHGRNVGVGTCLQAVLQRGRSVVAPAPDAADMLTVFAYAVDGAGEDTILDGGGRVQSMTDDATGIVVVDVERGGDGAVLNQVGAVGKAHETCRVILVRGNSARHFHVLDSRVLDVAEWGKAAVAVISKCCRDGVAVAEERAAEGLAVCVAVSVAHHR